jgi:hypothetical protein
MRKKPEQYYREYHYVSHKLHKSDIRNQKLAKLYSLTYFLHKYCGHSFYQIADLFNITHTAAWKRYNRAIELMDSLTAEEPEPVEELTQ